MRVLCTWLLKAIYLAARIVKPFSTNVWNWLLAIAEDVIIFKWTRKQGVNR